MTTRLIGITISHRCYLPIHDATGFTPFQITFGRSPTLPVEAMVGTPPQQGKKDIPSYLTRLHNSLHTAYVAVRANIESAHQRNKERYDRERPFSPYSVGDLVWLHVPAIKAGRTKKFTSQWKGPYTVMDRISEVNYRLKLVGSSSKPLVVHHNRLKPYYGTPQQAPPAPTRPVTSLENSTHLWPDFRYSSVSPAGGY